MTEMKFLDLHGEWVAYLDEGRGEVILLLHGMAGSSQTWRSVVGPLSRHYRVVAPDLLGHGDSTKPRSDYSLGAFSVLVRDLLDELGITRATIVGHSLGGGIAIHLPAPGLRPAPGPGRQRRAGAGCGPAAASGVPARC